VVKEVQVTHYKCGICGCIWGTKESARECEEIGIPMQQFKIGQRVSFTSGPLPWMDKINKGKVLGTSVGLFHTRMYKVKFDGDSKVRNLCESYFEEIKGGEG